MSQRKVLFYVQHLLGIGHVKRATTLARAMFKVGMKVTLVSGGEYVPVINEQGMEFIQLSPLRAIDRTFSDLVDENGQTISKSLKESRKSQLLSLFESIEPDILVVEMFPFGRRKLEFEIIPLLKKAQLARNKPIIVSSVRDVLVQKNDQKKLCLLFINRLEICTKFTDRSDICHIKFVHK